MVHDDRDAFHVDPTFPLVDCKFLLDPFLEEIGAESLSRTLEKNQTKFLVKILVTSMNRT